MTYSPNNLEIFTAAYAGALSGMGISDRVPTDPLPAHYSGLASVAGAFAQSFDTQWGSNPANTYEIEATQQCCCDAWEQRAPQAVVPNLTPSSYNNLCDALIAIIKAGSAYFILQGITPPSPPGPNNSWLEPAWFIAPITGNDNAAGTDIAHPIKTYAALVNRWGTTSPVLPQPTDLTFLEDQPDFSDPVVLDCTVAPETGAGGIFRLKGAPEIVGTGTFTAVTVKNRATGTRWQATDPLQNWAPFIGYFIHDTTVDAWFQVEADLGAGVARLSEPLGPSSETMATPPEIAIATGNAYKIVKPTKVFIAKLTPESASGSACLMQSIWAVRPEPDFGSMSVGSVNVSFMGMIECRIDPFVETPDFTANIVSSNCYFQGGLDLAGGLVIGGVIAGVFVTNGSQVKIDGDVIIKGPTGFSDMNIVGAAYFDSNLDIPNLGPTGAGSSTLAVTDGLFYRVAAFWGPGAINVHVGGDLQYSGTAVGAFLNAGGLTLDGAANASGYDPTIATWNGPIAITPANLDAAHPGGFNGVAYGNSGSKIRKVS